MMSDQGSGLDGHAESATKRRQVRDLNPDMLANSDTEYGWRRRKNVKRAREISYIDSWKT